MVVLNIYNAWYIPDTGIHLAEKPNVTARYESVIPEWVRESSGSGTGAVVKFCPVTAYSAIIAVNGKTNATLHSCIRLELEKLHLLYNIPRIQMYELVPASRNRPRCGTMITGLEITVRWKACPVT